MHKFPRYALPVVLSIIIASGAGSASAAEPETAPSLTADWPMDNHDPAGWRYNAAENTLRPANAGQLVEKWRFPPAGAPTFQNVGDAVASGIAVGNGVANFNTLGSGKLIALGAAIGKVLKENDLGQVRCGPSLSRGHVYVGSGNTIFSAAPSESFFPKQMTGNVCCFGLPQAGTAFRFVNQSGGEYADADCYWSLDHGKTWHSFADEPTTPCPTGNGRVYLRQGAPPANFDDRTTRWDFIEYALDNAGWHGNTTQVDAFCLPITITLGDKQVGIDKSRRELIAAFRKEAPAEFQKCAASDLWLMSPCRAGFGAGGPHENYFDKYIDEIWAKYARKQPTPSGKWIGEVTGEKLTFTPVGGGESISCPKKPSTQDAFLGTGDLATNPRFCAAINRHVLDDPADWLDPRKYYLAEPYNWYAKFFHDHSLGNKAYGFCYDDVGDQGAFFSGRGDEVVVTLYGDASKPASTAAGRSADDLIIRTANITSEGTRMAAEVFAPKNPDHAKLPTIIMSHGWGGTAELLRPDAMRFARAGFLVVAFDYRGWGKSDSRLVPVGKPVTNDGKLIAEVREVREVVDPIDQTTDILNVINWVAGEEQCDPDRIGLWGSSFSGGHVVYVAARDPRVKAFVSQVGSLDGRWVLGPTLRQYTFDQAAARTRGTIGYPKPREKFGSLTGAPILEEILLKVVDR
jgi:dienelactone hydrolase